tara:strand:+ start:242 stop:553 length:312 start_codon:yes stop_codon:yes gene_type:complete
MKETFEYVLRKVVEQGEPSIGETGQCLYRGPNGLKCAAGHLLSDEDYSPDMEGLRVVDVFHNHPHKWLISQMQKAHDIAAVTPDTFVEEFKRRMDYIKKEYNI